jgi:hypothetical protein
MKKIKFLVILFLVAFAFNSKAQKFTAFSEDSIKFVKELDAYFQENTPNKEEAKKFTDDFR